MLVSLQRLSGSLVVVPQFGQLGHTVGTSGSYLDIRTLIWTHRYRISHISSPRTQRIPIFNILTTESEEATTYDPLHDRIRQQQDRQTDECTPCGRLVSKGCRDGSGDDAERFRRGPLLHLSSSVLLFGRWRAARSLVGQSRRRALGWGGVFGSEAFHALFDRNDPVTGTGLGRRMGDNSVREFDGTFSAPKSVSVLFGLATKRPETRWWRSLGNTRKQKGKTPSTR